MLQSGKRCKTNDMSEREAHRVDDEASDTETITEVMHIAEGRLRERER